MTGLTEEILTHRAPSDHSMGDARALLRKGAFRGFARSEDGQLVFAECKGSAKEPYKVSLDFSSGTEHPTFRCSCPSRQRPCKHALALGLAFVQKGSHFPVKEPPADLVEKSEKLRERKEKKGT
ncbi:MAG: SWIM zinc finger family protein, partial [Polyangiaceae bacterium]|nr:SWIM zinc finger family protein [Polyangiaceae bacterium]